jgi:hypothetical protein
VGVALAAMLAVLIAAHLCIVVGLAWRRAWGRAAAALLVPPLAPWWGWREGGARARTAVVAWLAAVAIYAVLRAFTS